MQKYEVVNRLTEALAEVKDIDLRGHKAGSAVHEKVTVARQTLAEAVEELGSEQ